LKYKIIIISIILIGLFVWSYFLNEKFDVGTKLIYLNHHDSVQYLGVNACRDCHLDKYETFVETGMGRSFYEANVLNSAANFSNITPVYDSFLDLYYLPYTFNNEIFIKEYRMKDNDTIYSRTEKIRYIVGSGHHTNSHLIEENGFLYQAPLTFYTQKGQWDLPPGFENGQNSRFGRKIGLECMSCHNALPNYTQGTDNRYSDLAHGISCERCHGPGQIHVQKMRKGEVVDIQNETDFSIVNPRKLSWARQIDICQRCHLQGNAVLKSGKTFSSFKPGMKLSETFDQFSPEYKGDDDFVMAAHAERFQKSKCFIKSAEGDINQENARIGFTCISCHNPHLSVRKTNIQHFNTVCSSCHSESPQQKLCSAPKNKIELQSNNCVACHMPSSATSDIPHVTVHDHYIKKYPSIKSGKSELLGLRCITNNQPGLLTETEAYISYFEKFESNNFYINKAMELAVKLDKKQIEHLVVLIHLHYVNQKYDEIIKLSKSYSDFKDAWTNYRVAKSYENKGDVKNASKWMSLIEIAEPDNIEFMTQYASLLVKQQQYKKAKVLLERILKLNAKLPTSQALLGVVYLNMNELALAKKHLTFALKWDPDFLLALKNLQLLYERIGDKIAQNEINERIQIIIKRKQMTKG
jgi:hypothetical protein